jgi:hypothetical protein
MRAATPNLNWCRQRGGIWGNSCCWTIEVHEGMIFGDGIFVSFPKLFAVIFMLMNWLCQK